jgi:O-methyltransferase
MVIRDSRGGRLGNCSRSRRLIVWAAAGMAVDKRPPLRLSQRVARRLTPHLLSVRQRLWGWPTFSRQVTALMASAADPVRLGTIDLAFRTLNDEDVQGASAEVGVHRGDLSVILRQLAPERKLYLFDTFAGFPDPAGDDRFRDTSAEFVRSRFPADASIDVREGMFPDTASGLEAEQFAFVMLDADRYQVTLDGLAFFYPRLTPGAFLFIHDYDSPEFDYGAMKACREFLADKPERPIALPDFNGSAVFRRLAT